MKGVEPLFMHALSPWCKNTVYIFARFGGGACHLHTRGHGIRREEEEVFAKKLLLCACRPSFARLVKTKVFFLGENFLSSPHSFRPKKRLVKGVIRGEKSCRCVASAANTTCALEKGAEACKSLSSKKKKEEE